MTDLDMILKALNREAEWCESSDDRIIAEIGYRLQRVADDIEEIRAEGGACTP